MDIQTRLVHAGEERIKGAVVTPIFQSSTLFHLRRKSTTTSAISASTTRPTTAPCTPNWPLSAAARTPWCRLRDGGDHHRIDDRAQQRRSPADPKTASTGARTAL